jgi:hypothetical protein
MSGRIDSAHVYVHFLQSDMHRDRVNNYNRTHFVYPTKEKFSVQFHEDFWRNVRRARSCIALSDIKMATMAMNSA